MSSRMNKLLLPITFAVLLIPQIAWGQGVIKGRYGTLHFNNDELLKEFNEQIDLNRKLSYYMRKKRIVTVGDEVMAKLETIIERVEVVLDMFPDNLNINVVLLPDQSDVSRMFLQKYGKKANHIAYYSLSEDTIYISVDDARLRVIAHEIGHAVVDHFFKVRPPYNIHELMAQFAEKHVDD